MKGYSHGMKKKSKAKPKKKSSMRGYGSARKGGKKK